MESSTHQAGGGKTLGTWNLEGQVLGGEGSWADSLVLLCLLLDVADPLSDLL